MYLRPKTSFLLIAACLVVSAGIFLGYRYFGSTARAAELAQAAKDAAYTEHMLFLERTSPGRPIRIRIPAIKVDAKIQNVGLDPDGSVGAPKGPTDAGWYYSGAFPGATGAAVIDGHSGWVRNTPAAFDRLGEVHVGDNIYVEDQKGIVSAFVVRKLAKFGQYQDTSAIMTSKDGGSHLNLITCSGTWDPTKHLYSDRTVVFSDLVI